MTVIDEVEETCFDLLLVDGLSYTNGERLKQVQQTFKWQAHKGRPFSGTHICVEGVGAQGELEALILTTDRTFAAMSELFRKKPEPGFPAIKRVHGFVDYDGGAFWAVIQALTVTLQEHLHDPFTPEIANVKFKNFHSAWEDIQADPVEATDYYGDLDIRKF